MNLFLAGTSFLPEYGGPAFAVSALAAALSAEGARVALWAPDGSAISTSLLPERSGVIRLAGALDRALAVFDHTDIVHDNGIWPLYHHFMSQWAQSRNVPRVVSTRGMLQPWALRYRGWKKRVAWTLYQRRDLDTAAGLHATSKSEASNLARFALRAPIHVVPTGIDVPSSPPLRTFQAKPRVALFLGRIHPVKGLDQLIEAWAQVRPSGWKLTIAGPDETGQRAQLERAVAAHGLDDEILFVGSIAPERKQEIYLAANLFILPSHSENFGLVVAEALAHRLPVLTTTGTPWTSLSERGCGWCVPASIDGLVRGLIEATRLSPPELESMGRRGRELIEREYGWGSIARRMMYVYEMSLRRSISEKIW